MIINTKNRSLAVRLLAIASAMAFVLVGCTEPEDPGSLNPNRPPQTRLSNVPPPGTISTSPLVSLSWLGDDPDGFVVAYRYTWTYQLCQTCPVEKKEYTYVLNIMVGGLALIIDGNESSAPAVYKFFSTLPPEGLDTARLNGLARGDTILFADVPVWASNPDYERYPTHESPSRGTFIFDSQDSLNPHIFEVAAIDNNGALDPDPATVDFSTPQVPPPDVEIVSGPGFKPPGSTTFPDTVIVLNDTTDTYRGIPFSFQGYDPNSRTVEYSWIIDRDEWPAESVEEHWSPFTLNNTALVKGSDIPDPYRLEHKIYIRGRNEFGSISTRGYFTKPIDGGAAFDTTWAYASFNAVYPEFAKPNAVKRILILVNAFDWDTLAVMPYKPQMDSLVQYYAELYDALGLAGQYDVFKVPYTRPGLMGAWPSLGVLGQYSLIHVVGDVLNDNFRLPIISGTNQKKLTDYCNAGGKVLMNGWAMTSPINLPTTPTFLNNILHVLAEQRAANDTQFVAAVHQAIPDADQYPDIRVDHAKFAPAWGGGLPTILIYQAYGFGEIIYRYDSKDDRPQFEGGVIGVRYLGLTYDVIYLGFPLYYMEQPMAVEVVRKALRDLKHL